MWTIFKKYFIFKWILGKLSIVLALSSDWNYLNSVVNFSLHIFPGKFNPQVWDSFALDLKMSFWKSRLMLRKSCETFNKPLKSRKLYFAWRKRNLYLKISLALKWELWILERLQIWPNIANLSSHWLIVFEIRASNLKQAIYILCKFFIVLPRHTSRRQDIKTFYLNISHVLWHTLLSLFSKECKKEEGRKHQHFCAVEPFSL